MTLEKTLRTIVVGGIFALPFIVFIVADSLFFPFITGKNFTFRILVEVIAAGWLALTLVHPLYRPRRSPLLIAFAIFITVIAIADATGVNPFKSFWSNFERMDGWITLAHLFVYTIVASAVLSTEKLWRTFWHISIGVAVIVGSHAILQFFGIASLNPGFSSTSRLDATLGNPIYLASYMLFHVFMAAFFLVREWRAGTSAVSPGVAYGTAGALQCAILITTLPIFKVSPQKWFLALLLLSGVAWAFAWVMTVAKLSRSTLAATILFFGIILFLTGTRGAILGLVGGILLAALLFAIFGNSKIARRTAIGTIVTIVLLSGMLYLVRDQASVQNIPILGRLATISLSDGTVQSRVMNWGMAWEGVKERPLLGWGQENYAIVFSKYYNPNMYNQEQWFDRVHNVVFDWLVAGGILGLLAYLALFASALFLIWKKSAFTLAEGALLTGLLAAYFFQNLFVFDNILSYLLFATVLAYIAYRAGEYTNAPRVLGTRLAPPRAFPIIAAVSVGIVCITVWFVNVRAIEANKLLLQALSPQQEGILKNLTYFETAISYNTLGLQEMREHLLQGTVQLARLELPLAVKQKFVDLAATQMTLQAESSPLDPRFPLFLGVLLDNYGAHEQAKVALERAHALSPGKQTILFELASNAFSRGDMTASLEYLRKAYELAPQFPEVRVIYASMAIRAGNDALGDELLEPLLEEGLAADARVAAAYVARGRYDKIIPIWEKYLQVDPSSKVAYTTLASAYYAVGNTERAILILRKAAEVHPDMLPQVQEMIQAIESGEGV